MSNVIPFKRPEVEIEEEVVVYRCGCGCEKFTLHKQQIECVGCHSYRSVLEVYGLEKEETA